MTPIITLAYLKTFLPIRAGNTDFDAKLTEIIKTASQMIEDYCHMEFAEAARTQYFTSRATRHIGLDLHGGSEDGKLLTAREQLLVLNCKPVSEADPVSVYYDPKGRFGDDVSALDPEVDYRVDYLNGLIYLTYPTSYVRRGVKVEFTAGYAVASGTLQDSAPTDLKMACLVQSIFLFNKLTPENIGVSEDREEGSTSTGTYTKPAGLVPEAAAMLKNYRQVLVGRG